MNLERLLTAARRPAWEWFETVAATLLAAALGYWADPANPFFFRADFAWMALAPALLALRYGVLPGLASCAILTALWFGARELDLVPPVAPAAALLGTLILTMVCGEFAGIWGGRLRRLELSNRYLDERLERITRQHYLLMLSHDRLEQDQFTRPVTLRSALVRIRTLAGTQQAPAGYPGMADLLELLGQFCQLEVASVHACPRGVPDSAILNAIGAAQPLAVEDPLVAYCIAKRALSHVQMSELRGAAHSRYLVVAPVASGDGGLIALLAIEQMPFLALHGEALATLTVLLGYYADALAVSRAARVMQRALPGCPLDFADELNRCHRMWLDARVYSSLLVIKFGAHPDSAAFAALIRRQFRDLDMVWEIPQPHGPVFLALMPLAGPAGVEGCLVRLEASLDQRHQVNFDAARIAPFAQQIGDEDPFVTLKLMLENFDVRL